MNALKYIFCLLFIIFRYTNGESLTAESKNEAVEQQTLKSRV